MYYETGYSVAYLLICLAWSFGWGFATAAVRERRGYGRRWFWFGFFLGLIPFIIACSIPAKREDPQDVLNRLLAEQATRNYTADNTNGWQCSCGRTNAVYVSTCSCGLSKRQAGVSAADNTANQEN